MSNNQAEQPSLSTLIAPYLPALRRYSRALCGRQDTGDLYVRTVLEALIADPKMFKHDGDDGSEPRIELFRIFHAIWQVADDAESDFSRINMPQELSAQSHLQQLTPLARQALLLTVMEGFSTLQAAAILETEQGHVEALLDEARADLDAQMKTEVLIIEDEPIIALDIQRIVEEMGHTVTGNATTRDEAVALAAETQPGLVLADVRLADESSGIDAVNDILTAMDVPVIFITAYPERLLTGERPEPTFLISKPFMPDAVKVAIAQALIFNRPSMAKAS